MSSEPRGTSRHVALVAVFGFWLPGCGGKLESTPPPSAVHGDAPQLFASGTRLQAHYLDGGGGARKLLAFHDSRLNMECQFVETAVGRYACLPVLSTSTFSDSACSAPTLPDARACPGFPAPAAGQFISAPAADCSAQVGAYSLDTLQSEAGQNRGFTWTVFGACWSPSTQAAPQAQWTTKPEPLARFVQGTLSIIGAAGGVQATRVTGEDGSFSTLELVTAGVVCTPFPFGSVERCVPQPVANTYTNSYADSSCTDANIAFVGLNFEQQCAGLQAQYMIQSTGNNCRGYSTIYSLGDLVSPAFSSPGSGLCSALDLTDPGSEGQSFYRVGPSVSATVLPVVHSVQIGTSTLTVGYYADSADTPILARDNVWSPGDWSLPDGTACTLVSDASGQLRCVHDALIVDTADYFADANCTEPVYTDNFECAPRPYAYIVNEASDGCSQKLTQTHLAKVDSDPVYSMQAGSCQLDPYSPLNPHFTLGDPVANADTLFPIIAETTDP